MSLATIFGVFALVSLLGGTPTIQSAMLWQGAHPPSPEAATSQSPQQQAKRHQQTTPEQAKPEQQTTPEQQAKPEQPAPPDSSRTPENVPQNVTPEKPDCASSSSPKNKKHNSKSGAGTQAATGPKKTVVRNGSTADPVVQLAPSVTDQQASQQRQSTAQLLASTDANLNKISARQLNSSQQDMVNQIRNYVQQSKTAQAAGDLQRARNLAFKAQLLSDEVLRH